MTIKELSPILADQIAAGEVVERPASVVKELIENAIDANATEILIRIEEAGLRKIQIIDDGDGIPKDQVEMAFRRHATSKIASQQDLFRIRSLGFRGEALPSIASISELTIETAQKNKQGCHLKIMGGEIIENRPSIARKGTNIIVEKLFYNTPARLKYIRTLQTELATITNIVNREALGHPEIKFELIHDHRTLLKTTGSGQILETLAAVYGRKVAEQMLEIKSESDDFIITGYTSKPALTRSSRHYTSVFINNRYIKNQILFKALEKGYGSKLMVGRYPVATLKIELDPLLVDVNVHPTKQEVRLSKETKLYEQIIEAVQGVFQNENLIPNVGQDFIEDPSPVEKPVTKQVEQGQLFYYDQPLGVDQARSNRKEKILETNRTRQRSMPLAKSGYQPQVDNQSFVDQSPAANIQDVEHEKIKADGDQHSKATPLEIASQMDRKEATQDQAFPSLDYIGQLHDTYLLAQNEQGFYMIDQHAAQERIKYEEYRESIGQVDQHLQELLIPLVFELSADQALILEEKETLLREVGLHFEPFGQNTFQLQAYPSWIIPGQEEDTVWEMLEMLFVEGDISIHRLREATAIMMSCKRSIKANHRLSDLQSQQLLNDLANCENPYNCPHGRPVLVQFTRTDLEKMFKRIQDPHKSAREA